MTCHTSPWNSLQANHLSTQATKNIINLHSQTVKTIGNIKIIAPSICTVIDICGHTHKPATVFDVILNGWYISDIYLSNNHNTRIDSKVFSLPLIYRPGVSLHREKNSRFIKLTSGGNLDFHKNKCIRCGWQFGDIVCPKPILAGPRAGKAHVNSITLFILVCEASFTITFSYHVNNKCHGIIFCNLQ